VGAIVGLFNRLGADSEAESAVDDYGLARARLVHTPLFCGLAAVGGVVITALLPVVLNVAAVTPRAATASPTAVSAPARQATGNPTLTTGAAATAAATADSGQEAPSLVAIFDLQRHPFGLVIAAIFGLTPRLLIRRLQEQTDRYKADLRSTKAPATAPATA
jgi:hypothetical protein